MFRNFAAAFGKATVRGTARVGIPLVFSLYHFNNRVRFFEVPETSVIIKGVYDNKIRRSSPIEKIFEVFANLKTEDGLRMSFFDLMRAICPFNYSTKDIDELKSHVEKHPPKTIQKLFDLDDSHNLSIYEFYIFWVFHEISIPDLQDHFLGVSQVDIINGVSHKKIDLSLPVKKEDFVSFLKSRGTDAQVALVETSLPDGRSAKVTKEDFDENLLVFTDRLYAGAETITLGSIIKSKKAVRDDIYEFEFNSFPITEQGNISNEDFAKCLISYCAPNHRKGYFNLLQKTPLEEGEVSLEEFKAFKEFVSDDMEEFNKIIKDQGVLTEKKFKKVFDDLSSDNFYKLSPTQYKVMFRLLDLNGDGRVSYEEFNYLLNSAHKLGRSIEKGVD